MKENLLQKELSKIAQTGHSTAVAQLIEQLLPTAEILGLNSIIGNFYLLLIVWWDKNKDKIGQIKDTKSKLH